MAELTPNEQMQVRMQKMDELKALGIDPFGHRYDRKHSSREIIEQFETLEGSQTSVAGRVMAIREHGKACFLVIADKEGQIQVYVRLDDVGEEQFNQLKLWDIGDIAAAEGEVFKTKRGEISVKANKLIFLSKCLRPLPEKFHGLTDVETRYRQRYLDLTMNPDVRETFVLRSKIIRAMRNYLDSQDFLEVETPVLHHVAGGAAARPFVTHHNALDMELHLRIALELHLKRLIVGGLERVYELGRVFRNEGISVRHNPEFTMLELYQAFGDYHSMMELVENMLHYVCMEVLGTDKVDYQGTELSFAVPWKRITMFDAIKEHAGVDFAQIKTDEEARKVAQEKGIEFEKNAARGEIINLFFEEYVEEKLIQPTFVMDYPIEVSPLSKRKNDEPDMTARFEAFIYGREIVNAYSELNDPLDQRARFERQMEQRAQGDEEAPELDEDYLRAMEYGMPPIGGMGMGIDRTVMFLTNAASIRDVLLFPTLRAKDI